MKTLLTKITLDAVLSAINENYINALKKIEPNTINYYSLKMPRGLKPGSIAGLTKKNKVYAYGQYEKTIRLTVKEAYKSYGINNGIEENDTLEDFIKQIAATHSEKITPDTLIYCNIFNDVQYSFSNAPSISIGTTRFIRYFPNGLTVSFSMDKEA